MRARVGNVGPNLDSLKPSEAIVARQVENGGGQMPAFKDSLSAAEIQAVAKRLAWPVALGEVQLRG